MKLPGLTSITMIAAGQHHAAAIDAHGQLWTWGSDHVGELGEDHLGVIR
jgi:alpha-tubulin suppressor-like RCC1 family protein